MRVFSPQTVDHPWRETGWILLLAALVVFDMYWLVVSLVPSFVRWLGPLGWGLPVSA